jgi:hypothetical protein
MNRLMTFSELQQALDRAIQEVLTSEGFRRTALGTWNRRRNEELSVIQFQKHSGAQTFCVNLGIHYGFLPKAGTGASLNGDQIEFPECELGIRLTERATDKDQWWPISEMSIAPVADLVVTRGLAVFELYRLDGDLASLDAKAIEAGNLGLLTPVTKVRACLLLALLHQHMGNNEKSIEAATIGVKLAGMAVGPKKVLKDILRRFGEPA